MSRLQYRLFFDTSVYIAALLSPTGAASELLRLAEAGAIRMIVSEQVVVETDRVLAGKFPALIQENRQLWKHLAPEIAPTPTVRQAEPFLKKLPRGDALILCAAHYAAPAAFVTWNTRDFMAQDIASLVNFPIVVPADALGLFRMWVEPFLGE